MHRYGVVGFSEGRGSAAVVNLHGSRQGKTDRKSNGHPRGVAVFPLYSSTVYSACMHPHRIALCISDRGSSNDRASIVGGALERIFQPLRDQIHHHIPSWTAVVREDKRSPTHKAAKACIHKYQALRLVLKPGRMVAPSRLLTPRREGACIRKFAEPSDDLHHIACLSSVRACCGLRLRPRYCGHQHCRTAQAKSACIVHGHLHGFAMYISSCWLSFRNVPSHT